MKRYPAKWLSFNDFSGEVIKSYEPISFFGGVDPRTGKIVERENKLFGKSIKNKVFLVPFGKGSTVGSYVLYALKKNESAPLAIIAYRYDLIISSGCVISRIPYGLVSKEVWEKISDGSRVRARREQMLLEIF